MNFNTLRDQIGVGNLMAVGAREFFTDGPNSFGFRVGSKRGYSESITIRLDVARDTYSVCYMRMKKRGLDILTEEIPDVQADQIGAIVREMGDRA